MIANVFVFAVVVGAGALRLAPLTKNTTKPASLGRILADVGTTFRSNMYSRSFRVNAEAYAYTSRGHGVAPDVLTCAKSIKAGIQKLRVTYGPGASSVFEQACDHSGVYLDLGGDKAACTSLMVSLKEEYEGEQNYHRWCRKAAMAESESMQAALKMLESDPEAKKLMGKCEEKCPSIAKIIETGAAIDAHWMKMFTQPPAEQTWDEWKESYKKFVAELDTLHATICDHRAKAKCTLGSMAQSCGKMLEKVHLPKAVLGQFFKYCDMKAPCAKACNGITEKCHGFMDKEMFAAWGGDKEKFGMCGALPAVEECAAKEECHEFMEFTGFGEKALKKPRKMCDVWQSPCYTTIAKRCNSTKVAFHGPPFDASAPPAPKKPTCASKLGWSSPWSPIEESTKKECCPKFTDLGKCAANVGCTKTLKGILRNTPSYWYPYADGIKESCPTAWQGTFDV